MLRISIIVLSLLFQGTVFGWKETLSERATNPITNLSQMQNENDFSPSNYGTDECTNTFYVKPVMALNKREWFPFEQLMRLKFQIPSLPNSSTTHRGTSLGDTQFFDLLITEVSWGRWGVGPMLIFPTATTTDAGQGKWQIGPALGLSILKYKRWQIGFIAQNPISVAGNPNKSNQNYLLFQPFITYHFTKNSYVLTNAEWTIDWKNSTQQIPVNIGIGTTFDVVAQFKIDTSLQYEQMVYQNASRQAGFVTQSTIQFSINLLFPD